MGVADQLLSGGAGVAKGAGMGASVGGPLAPLTGAIGGLLGGAVGLFTAKRRAKQAKLLEGENQRENVMNQAWSGLLGQKDKLAQNIETPSVLGGALQGGMAGAMQGLNVYRGLQGDKKNDELLARLRNAQGA